MIWNSLTFWTLIAGILAFVLKFFVPALPVDATTILAVMLFVLGLVGIVPTLRLKAKAAALTFGDLLKSLDFWKMVVGFVGFVIHFYFPSFPLDDLTMLALVVFFLSLFGISPELKALKQLKKY